MPRYYAIVASLPQLVPFAEAEHLALSQHDLSARLSSLDEIEADDLWYALPLVCWRRLRRQRRDDRQARRLAQLAQTMRPPALRTILDWRVDQLGVLAGLRRKLAGGTAPTARENWAAGRWCGHIRRHWDAPGFALSALVPWARAAEDHLRAADALGLERLLAEHFWDFLGRVGEREPFGFAPIAAFVFKWDLHRSWLAHDEVRAAQRFAQLVHEVTRDHRIA